jgi:hypothetical protein
LALLFQTPEFCIPDAKPIGIKESFINIPDYQHYSDAKFCLLKFLPSSDKTSTSSSSAANNFALI